MKHFKDVHLVLKESKGYNEGDGIKVTLETPENKEELDYEIYIDAAAEAGYAGCDCTMSLKDLIYKIKDIIPYEWLADIKEEKESDQIRTKRIMKELITF